MTHDSSRQSDDLEEMRILQQERLLVEITELMCKTMKSRGVKRGHLAKQLKKTRGRISQILNGEANLTLRTVADVFTALGKNLVVNVESICPEETIPPAQIIDMEPQHLDAESTR